MPTAKFPKQISEEKEISKSANFNVENNEVKKIADQEILTQQEKEIYKRDILETISETEQPIKKPQPIEPPTQIPAAIVADKSETLVIIEDILSEDLQDAYTRMDPNLQKKFKAEGERVAGMIEKMLHETQVNTSKIFSLILGWLKLIPGVNKFFLDQEAKLKADKIIKINK